MQTYIITNCDVITMATCLLVEDDTHKVSHEHTEVRLGKTLYIGCHMASPLPLHCVGIYMCQ